MRSLAPEDGDWTLLAAGAATPNPDARLAVETVEHTGEIDLNFRVEVEAAIKKV